MPDQKKYRKRLRDKNKSELKKDLPKQTKREANQERDAFGKMRGEGSSSPVQQASFLERKRLRMKMRGESDTEEYKELSKQIREIVRTFNLSPTIGRQTHFKKK